MKRLGLTLVAVLSLATATFAAGNQPVTEKWEGNINVEKLSKYLKLSSTQHEEVATICEFFSEQVKRANDADKDQEELLRKAVLSNLKLMKQTLDKKQYANYTKVLNITLRNKGIELEKK